MMVPNVGKGSTGGVDKQSTVQNAARGNASGVDRQSISYKMLPRKCCLSGAQFWVPKTITKPAPAKWSSMVWLGCLEEDDTNEKT